MSINRRLLPSIHHAISLNDFQIYLNERAILSRADLSELNPYYTRFFSDAKDVRTENWNRVFGNFTDYGSRFARPNTSAVPNAYGPILIIFKSNYFQSIIDDNSVRVTKKTISSNSFNPDTDLIDISTLHEYFEINPRGFYNYPKNEFNGIEFSCTQRLDISPATIHKIIIDPIYHNDIRLIDKVRELLTNYPTDIELTERELTQDKIDILRHLVSWSNSLNGRLLHKNINLRDHVPEHLQNWFDNLNDTGVKILASWLTYTYNGTLIHME